VGCWHGDQIPVPFQQDGSAQLPSWLRRCTGSPGFFDDLLNTGRNLGVDMTAMSSFQADIQAFAAVAGQTSKLHSQ
jgi:hypothetical protein